MTILTTIIIGALGLFCCAILFDIFKNTNRK